MNNAERENVTCNLQLATCNLPSLDKVLREWTTKFLDQPKISLNLSLIQRKALSIKEQLLNDSKGADTRTGLVKTGPNIWALQPNLADD